MAEIDAQNDTYTLLIEINQIAFSDGQYEVAYHALTAAFHYAKDFEDAERLDEVRIIAVDQLAYLNSDETEISLSVPHRRNRNAYEALISMAQVRAQLFRELNRFR